MKTQNKLLSLGLAIGLSIPLLVGFQKAQVDPVNGIKVQVTSTATGTGHLGAVKVDTISTNTNHIGKVKVDSIAAGTTHIGGVTVDTIAAGANIIGKVGIDQTTPGTTNAVAQSGTWTVQPGNTANTTAWKVDGSAVTQPVSIATLPALAAGSATVGNVGILPVTSGGASIYRVFSANNTNAANIKASAGQIYGFYFANLNAAVRYVKFYNTAGTPTVGTDTPVLTLPLVPSSGLTQSFPMGISFGTGIGIGIVTGLADNDVTAPSANDVIINLLYK